MRKRSSISVLYEMLRHPKDSRNAVMTRSNRNTTRAETNELLLKSRSDTENNNASKIMMLNSWPMGNSSVNLKLGSGKTTKAVKPNKQNNKANVVPSTSQEFRGLSSRSDLMSGGIPSIPSQHVLACSFHCSLSAVLLKNRFRKSLSCLLAANSSSGTRPDIADAAACCC